MKRNARGFTLVEILIVVIILGILAAIVIPQFTSASSDARNSSLSSTLQSLRSQTELFKTQHNDTPPSSAANFWSSLQNKSTMGDTSAASTTVGTLGPYVQNYIANPLNANTIVSSAAGATVGWVYTIGTNGYSISATNTTGTGLLTY